MSVLRVEANGCLKGELKYIQTPQKWSQMGKREEITGMVHYILIRPWWLDYNC